MTMEPEKQLHLGYDQIKAAVVGRHSLKAAYAEIAEMMQGGALPYVLTGGVCCLLTCTEAIARVVGLPVGDTTKLEAFFRASHAQRLHSCERAQATNDWEALHWMAMAMTACIQPHAGAIRFEGLKPICDAASAPRGV